MKMYALDLILVEYVQYTRKNQLLNIAHKTQYLQISYIFDQLAMMISDITQQKLHAFIDAIASHIDVSIMFTIRLQLLWDCFIVYRNEHMIMSSNNY